MRHSAQRDESHACTAAFVAVALVTTVLVSTLAAPAASASAPYQPPQLTNPAVQTATLNVALQYANAVAGLDARTLRWFLYTIEHRESTFDVNFCNYNDGAGSWNGARSWFWPTRDHLPHGCGLTQPTGWGHEGMAFPGNAASAPASLYKGVYGWVSAPRAVTALSNPFDAQQNLARFVTEHVLPEFALIKAKNSWWSTDQVLRAVAFHWNKGDYVGYQSWNCDYLCLYDQYAATYKAAVLADPWPGASPTTLASSASEAATFALAPGSNAWWTEVGVRSATGTVTSVTASVNGGAPHALARTSWGAWAASYAVAPGSRTTFTAVVDGVSVTSASFGWT